MIKLAVEFHPTIMMILYSKTISYTNNFPHQIIFQISFKQKNALVYLVFNDWVNLQLHFSFLFVAQEI